MDFIFKIRNGALIYPNIEYCENIKDVEMLDNVLYIEKLSHLDYIIEETESYSEIYIGDVIKSANKNNYDGLHYCIYINKINNTIKFIADKHCLLPIYYIDIDEYKAISSSFIEISKLIKTKTYNKNFYLEIAIFYTPLNCKTLYNEIKRLDYGSSLEFGELLIVKKEKYFYEFFSQKPKSFNSSIKNITKKFIDNSEKYFETQNAISLTGGFDGRTITACAHYYKSSFENYSYGRIGSGDVDIPIYLTNNLNIKYSHVDLGKDYLINDYLECVQNYIKYSGGQNGFQYPQSLYAIKKMSKKYQSVVTGYLGSEILANPKDGDDEINPRTIIDILNKVEDFDNYVYSLSITLEQFGFINNKEEIKIALDRAKKYFDSLPNNLTKNQKIATFGFEKIFQYTFGVWIYNGMHYAKIRAPFLDIEFFNEISQTKVSQFYRKFLEKNPLKRFLGQLLYPKIIASTWPELNKLMSSKGYAPQDLLSNKGRMIILIEKIIRKNKTIDNHGLDKLSTVSGALIYLDTIEFDDLGLNINKQLFIELLQSNTINRSLCFLVLSRFEALRLLNK